ncbi:hypothetical protein CpB0134 [Chlamydia pneumoniae TW-183]|uniref:DUF748 domain-containing protein n=2 Tax=Chlamydia pneumoniae TaxID=83558 RepID=Q9Z948_CHLPN|nr:hypothetical protein [Chlamydia pneumoniae]AAD18286.1 CHLPS hypothetical protein [Chlamydia pneumoniae CWL029]AAF38454.1 conserved hypothetical protein [Chlamydia pneumoniae AR39]AAP98067.1 hypothetical protein CpB0134 [Chlamydia pneumoniae TW-183]ACZ33113.1 conserved hypothetical protein [Chlamydia pneumoniae LPCoLN]CRI32630.1 Uncharacterized protein BN1224_Wien1_A_01370 [Chlamydia pneumoniae]
MFKLLKNLFLIGCCIVGYFWMRKESIVEQWLSNRLHTQVTVGRVSIRTSGIKIRHICIHNPLASERFPYAAEIEYADVRFSSISMLLTKQLEISELIIHGANFTIFPYDSHGTKTNWSLVWKNFHPQKETPSNLWIDRAPVLIRRCLFLNTRLYGLRANHKDIPHLSVPSLEFHSHTSSAKELPKLSEALPSLLYLALEESLYHLNLPGDIIKPLSQQAHKHFYSSYPQFQDRLNDINTPGTPTEEIIGFIRGLFFH